LRDDRAEALGSVGNNHLATLRVAYQNLAEEITALSYREAFRGWS